MNRSGPVDSTNLGRVDSERIDSFQALIVGGLSAIVDGLSNDPWLRGTAYFIACMGSVKRKVAP